MIIKSFFDNKVILLQQKRFRDVRGFFSETFNKKQLIKIGIKDTFVQDNFSFSYNKGVVRGLHFQTPPMQQSKLIRVVNGKILDIVVDIRKKSKTYGQYKSFIISRQNWRQIYIPAGFAHGFCTLEKNTDIEYKVSNYYSKKHERTIQWDDKYLDINWRIDKNKVILSSKDKKANNFINFISPF